MDPKWVITRLQLHKKMMEFSQESIDIRKNRVLEYLKEHFHTNGNEDATTALVEFTRNSFFAPYLRNWKSVDRKNDRFLKKYDYWLKEEIKFPDIVIRCLPSSSSTVSDASSSRNRGRPTKEFEESSLVVKRRKTEELRKKTTVSELSFATSMKLKEEGQKDAAKLLKEATQTTPTRASKMLKILSTPVIEQHCYSLEEAVSLIINSNFTFDQYTLLRKGAKIHGHDLYPPYYKVLEKKKEFYPDEIVISAIKCEVPLQNILNKTCESIIKCISDGITPIGSLVLFCKWGFDGSSGFKAYKYQSQSVPRAEDSLFSTSIVPLRLKNINSGEILWKNPRPASTKYCRPIRLQWIQETSEVLRLEEAEIKRQIEALTPYKSPLGEIRFDLSLTMVDGKVCSSLTNTSSMTCYICNAKISHLNDIVSLRSRPILPDTLQFGLSVLHAYIRCFECLLHVSYRLEFKVWKVTKDRKAAFEARKKQIQNEFRARMGLLVDIPKSGAGTTNDGNTARRFFANPSLSSEITGLDEELIKRFSVILRTVNSGFEINIDKFEQYCLTTAERYVSLYDWFYMPPSVHKLLIHGPILVKEAVVPIGELSEEAQESKHKDIKRYRENHTLKINIEKVNEDLFHRLILSSDPLLSSFHIKMKNKRKPDDEISELLIIDETKEDWEEDEDA